MKTKKIIIWTIIGCIILYLIPNLFYIWKFRFNSISPTPSDWGVYGDFVGGSINPLISILNIIVLGYLTYIISDVDGKRADENINAQKIITLNQMRYNNVLELSKTLDTFSNVSTEITSENNNTFLNISIALNSFRNHSYSLFKNLFTNEFDKEYYHPLNSSITQMSDLVSDIKSKVNQIKDNESIINYLIEQLKSKDQKASIDEESIEIHKKIQEKLEENKVISNTANLLEMLLEPSRNYLEQKGKFINEVNKFIIKELTPDLKKH